MTNRLYQQIPHRSGATKKRHRNSGKGFGTLPKMHTAIPHWGSLMLGLIIGVSLTSVVFFCFATTEITLKIPTKAAKDATINTSSTDDITASPTAAAAPTTALNKEPRFDFYTELTKSSHESNQVKPTKSSVLDLKSSGTHLNKYVVQVAAFKHRSDADALKAKLTLNGLEARIQIVKHDDGKLWHRVILGPFKNEAGAFAQKKILKSLEIDSALVLKQTD